MPTIEVNNVLRAAITTQCLDNCSKYFLKIVLIIQIRQWFFGDRVVQVFWGEVGVTHGFFESAWPRIRFDFQMNQS